jgi:D-3-phosphoglycerate dehydrogenase / 2-oxoglutarate reductase
MLGEYDMSNMANTGSGFRVLVTTASLQDTPGRHHRLLEETGWEIVTARGPLPEERMLDLVGECDAVICGDDVYTAAVMDRGLPRLKIISKYGIGLDRIDVPAATGRGIAVAYTPGVNHTTVAEHVYALLLGHMRNLVEEVTCTRARQWKRLTGCEVAGRTLGIIGLGRIGQEVALRAPAFGLKVVAYSAEWNEAFVARVGVRMLPDVESVLGESDIVTLHLPLTPESRHLLNRDRLALMKSGALLINTARGELVDLHALVQVLDTGRLRGYCADVLDQEPPPPHHPLLTHPRCYITPHIGSRTLQSVERQACKAIENVVAYLSGHFQDAVLANSAVLRTSRADSRSEELQGSHAV